MNVVAVLPAGPFDSTFSYECDEKLLPGVVVEVPFGKQRLLGLVMDDDVKTDIQLKNINKIFPYNIGNATLEFLKWVSNYTLIPKGNVLKMILAEKSIFSVLAAPAFTASLQTSTYADCICNCEVAPTLQAHLAYNSEDSEAENASPARTAYNSEDGEAENASPARTAYNSEDGEAENASPARTAYNSEDGEAENASPARTAYNSEDSEAENASPARTEALTHVSQILELSGGQLEAIKSIRDNGNRPFLLHGVTGSGKTEVYLSAVQDALEKGKQVLILFPEIALTNQIVDRIERYFGIRPVVWNSNITHKNRREAWIKAISGGGGIFVGARSALFLPFLNLGMIVVDEEHDSSYKQEEGWFYNARDMAIVLGHIRKIPVILSSATPSLESYVNAKNGKYGYAFMENRFGASQIPSIYLIDMKQCKFDGFISPVLLRAIKNTMARGEQSLIYLNRRGYSPITLCKSCGEKIACPNCTSWLVYHKNLDKMVCHYCNHRTSLPKKCSVCGEEDSLIPFGPGVERVFDELRSKLPEARIEIASSDTISSDKNIAELFTKIHNNEVDVIIGTQILAKGHHFPNITLVGIVDGDLGLHGADIRASEKTYQLISQVSGRAGRAEKEGKILIQTFNPSHSLFVALQSPDPNNFLDLEISSRRECDLPPFSKFAAIIISGTNKELTEKIARKLGDAKFKEISIFGPAPAPIFLLRGRVRWRILLKASKKNIINNLISKWIFSEKHPKNVKIQIDIDPISFL